MKSVEEFFQTFQHAQESSSFQHELSSTDLCQIELDSTLTLAIQRGWHIAPVLARSKYFRPSALAGYPTRDLIQLSHWVREYSECGCNWVVETGAKSGLLVLEFTYDIGREMVRYLCEDDWSFRSTLQFTDHNARFVCFRYSGQQIRILGDDFPGVYIHLGKCLLMPPSQTAMDFQISFLNPMAKLLDLPDWLLDARQGATENLNPSDKDGADNIAP
jgi:hypothetical protein